MRVVEKKMETCLTYYVILLLTGDFIGYITKTFVTMSTVDNEVDYQCIDILETCTYLPTQKKISGCGCAVDTAVCFT